MARYYVINKKTKTIESERDTDIAARTHIRNACSLFGKNQDDYTVAEGAKERDRIMKELKHG